MCSALGIFMLCAVAVNDVFPKEITRLKRQNFKYEDRWDWAWGYFEEIPIIIKNSSYSFSIEIVAVPEIKYSLETETNSSYSSTLSAKKISSQTKITATTPTEPLINVTPETKSTDVPILSRSESKPTHPPGTFAPEASPVTITSESKSSDIPNTETTITNFPSTTTIEEKYLISPTTVILDTTPIPINAVNSPSDNSNTESTVFDLPTTSTIKTKSTPPLTIFKQAATLIPITPESKPNEIPETTTIEPIHVKIGAPLAEIRLENSTQDVSPETETTTEMQSTTKKEPGLCDPLPEKPDFSAPGRRINEAQCMGYVWDMENRKKQKDWNRLCTKQLYVNHAVGGRKTEIGEFPHMGAIGWKAAVGNWVFKCGSSLISANFVLTAAHCTKASDKDSSIADPIPKIVRLGDKNIIDRTTIFSIPTDANISRIVVHPQYNAPTQYYDIALMELEEPVEFTRFIQPACLWNSFSTGEPEHEATLTGWGVIESGSRDISPELQAATVNVLDTAQCDQLLQHSHNRNWKGFQEHQLCAGKLAGGVDSCQGDSGGPLQMKMPLPKDITDQEGNMHYIVGIISFGVGCAHPNLPGVYTRVSSFIDWIEDNVWKNGHNRTYVAPPSDFISLTNFPNFGNINFG